ncbi:MAG: Gfo/Idh/MocA family oxidoreductase [Chitinophagaceae bacterium]|nr:Gfo/Idh/MocA family oxidoreductase [Chitinophagaceae bacterium]
MTHRREFLKHMALAGAGVGLLSSDVQAAAMAFAAPIKVGVIGLDTEHSVAFTRTLNDPQAPADVAGFRVVAAFPYGSRDIPSSVAMIPGFTEEMKKLGVEIVSSVDELIRRSDVILLETNDGRLHLQQALPVLKSRKRVFIDKPIAASLADAAAIFDAAKKYGTPLFSSSSLRFMDSAQSVAAGKIGKVLGADAYGPASMEKTHPDLFWYGIHAIEALYTVMGTGCKTVTRFYTEGTDVVVGIWADGRIGTFRGTRTGTYDFGGTVFGEKGVASIGPWQGYRPLVVKIAEFFRTGQAPVTAEETLEIFAFMEAAQQSRDQGGIPVALESMLQKARAK